MTNRSRLISALGVATVAAALAFAPDTSAGIKEDIPVVVDLGGRTATGALGTARNSADWRQVIGCSLQANAGVAHLSLMCEAMDAQGVAIQCASNDASLVTASLAISGDSQVTFTWDRFRQCTSLTVRNGSTLDLKRP